MTVVLEPGPDRQVHHVLRVVVTQPSDPYYSLQVTQPLSRDIPVGDRLRYSFWARATNNNFVRAVIEMARPPYAGYVINMISLTPQWRRYESMESSPGIPLGTAAVRLQVGKSAGTIEFADVTVEDAGVAPEYAAAKLAVRPEAVEARIRRYRMGDLTVRVVDAHGRLVRNARVSVDQTAHAFLFGCNIFGLSQNDPDPVLQENYRQEFAALFNYATLPFYWSSFEPKRGDEQFPPLIWMAQWCAQHNIQTKAHPLVWHQAYPAWAPTDATETIPLLQHRVTHIVTRMSPTTKYFDIVNEASSGAAGQAPANGESTWVVRDSPAKVVETVLGWARDAGRGQNDTFIDNDYDTSNANVAMLRRMQKDGRLPDAIGIQSHMHTGVWPLTQVWMVCDRFAQFHRPINFTETTVLSTNTPHIIPGDGPAATDWRTTPDGEASQAAYVKQFYSLLFSYPSLRAITWWDFSDRNSWMGAPSGLVRADMSPKPAYTALMDLIHKQWWTTSSGRTDKSGQFRVRAFYGMYSIMVIDSSGKQTLLPAFMPEESGSKTVIVRLR
jgi:GH35 family endo-1,4-beta-xylanase